MTDNADMSAAAEAKRDSVPAIPVRGRYYLTKCPNCGWVGSSEQCGVDYGCDDSDVYCPICQEAGCEEDATFPECAEHGEAVMRRLTAALARTERLEAALPYISAQLRHAYAHLVNGRVKDLRAFADGLLAPQIERLEALADPAPAEEA